MPRTRRRNTFPSLNLESLEQRDTPATVTSLLDDGSPGTLRAVIDAAASGEEIRFDRALDQGTIVLNGAPILIDKFVNIRNEAEPAVTISGGGRSRIFEVAGGAAPGALNLEGVTLADGTAADGAAVLNSGGGLSFVNVLVRDCVATGGGGAVASIGGTTILRSSTLHGNRAAGDGGGVYADGGSVGVFNCTVTSNEAGTDGSGRGGGVFVTGATATLNSTILADNLAADDGPDVYRLGGTVDASYSIIETAAAGALTTVGDGMLSGVDPLLGPLQLNGGFALSRAPLAGSPAIDAGDPAPPQNTAYDQRLSPFMRIANGRIDIGAVEVRQLPTVYGFSSTDPDLYVRVAGEPITYTLVVSVQEPSLPATGTVSFFDLATNRELGTVTGTPYVREGTTFYLFTLTTVLPVGYHNVGGKYNGDPNNAPSIRGYDNPISTVVIASLPFSVTGSTDGTATRYIPTAPDAADVVEAVTVRPFGDIAAAVRSATADVDGDRVPDTIFVTGPGTPFRVAVVSGIDNKTLLVEPFAPFEPTFTAGGYVAAGDFDRDGRAEFVVTPDQGGGPRVSVYSLAAGGALNRMANFFAFEPEFFGGARTTVADVNADGTPELILAAGFGGGPRVAVFDGTRVFGLDVPTAADRLVPDFFAFDPNLRDGAYVTAGDFDGDGYADLVFGAGNGGAPRVLALSGRQLLAEGSAAVLAAPLASFFVDGDETNRGGVRVATIDADGNDTPELAVASGVDRPGQVRIYRDATFPGGEPTDLQDLDPFGELLPGGAFVG